MAFFENGYALVIGIADYAHVRRLPKTILEDANSISHLLQDSNYCAYLPQQVRLLTNTQATAVNIRTNLKWLAKQTREADTAVLYFSGHGGQITTGPHTDNYLIPYEAKATDLPGTAISNTELINLLNNIQAGRLLVLFDCCHAGGIGDVKGGNLTGQSVVKSGLDDKMYERLGRGTGRAVIASSRSEEVSWVFPNMPNSLFTHHMLQAFKGEAPMRGDGLVRLFDLFDYVSERVSTDQPKQHPILKAEIEKNFPIALHLGGQETVAKQLSPKVYEHKPTIENYENIKLNDTEKEILERMHDGYGRIVFKSEMGGGFGGGRVFLVHPVAVGDNSELPVIVKTGPIAIIEQEWAAFKQYVENKVPQAANIKGELIYSPDRRWGGIRYPLAGNELYETTSLKSFCKEFNSGEISYVIEDQLFQIMKEMWRKHRNLDMAFVGGSFDPILPVNLKIQFVPNLPGTKPLTPENCIQSEFNAGNLVAVSGFEIVEVDHDASEITLNAPKTDLDLPKSYRLRFTEVMDMAGIGEGKIISNPLTGVVIETRESQIKGLVQAAFKDKIDTTATKIVLPEVGSVLNPIPEIPKYLKKNRHVRMGPIHGDLNLENILVVYDKRSRQVFLIDFANARQDIVLHDLWRLETGIWLYLVPEILKENGRSLSDIPGFVQNIHDNTSNFPELEKPLKIISAIRQQAVDYMVNSKDWSEYYYGLILYLIGALKFKNLDKLPFAPLPKQVAFVTAVSIFHILKESAMPSGIVNDNQNIPNKGKPMTPINPFDDANKKPPTNLPPGNRKDLYTILTSKIFATDDFKKICFDMDIFYEDIPGSSRADKARELILYLERYQRLEELPLILAKLRPQAKWDKVLINS